MSLYGIEKLPEMTNAEIAADIAKTRGGTIRMIVFAIIAELIVFALIAVSIAKASTPGDCDGNGKVDIGDPVWLINYIFAGGPAPKPCECPRSFFLFDNQIPQAVETYYLDSNWEEAYIGGDTLRRVDGVRRCYSIGQDSQPSYFLLLPESVVEIDSTEVFMMSVVVDDGGMLKYGARWQEGAIYGQPDLKQIFQQQYSRDHVDSTDYVSEMKHVAWCGADGEPEFTTMDECDRRQRFALWKRDWEAGVITYREYLVRRLNYKPETSDK